MARHTTSFAQIEVRLEIARLKHALDTIDFPESPSGHSVNDEVEIVVRQFSDLCGAHIGEAIKAYLERAMKADA